MGSDATTEAAQTQANATDKATATQLQMYNETVKRMSPWVDSGSSAMNTLNSLLPSLTSAYSLSKYQSSPEYQVAQNAMSDAIQQGMASAAAGGNYGSGNMATALQDNANKLALQGYSTGLSDYWSQNSNIFNMLNQLSQSGQNAAGNLASTGTQVANQVGANTIAGGNAIASGIVNSSNALTSNLSNASNTAMSGLSTYMKYQQYQNYLNSLSGGSGTGAATGALSDYYGTTGSVVGSDGAYSMYADLAA